MKPFVGICEISIIFNIKKYEENNNELFLDLLK